MPQSPELPGPKKKPKVENVAAPEVKSDVAAVKQPEAVTAKATGMKASKGLDAAVAQRLGFDSKKMDAALAGAVGFHSKKQDTAVAQAVGFNSKKLDGILAQAIGFNSKEMEGILGRAAAISVFDSSKLQELAGRITAPAFNAGLASALSNIDFGRFPAVDSVILDRVQSPKWPGIVAGGAPATAAASILADAEGPSAVGAASIIAAESTPGSIASAASAIAKLNQGRSKSAMTEALEAVARVQEAVEKAELEYDDVPESVELVEYQLSQYTTLLVEPMERSADLLRQSLEVSQRAEERAVAADRRAEAADSRALEDRKDAKRDRTWGRAGVIVGSALAFAGVILAFIALLR